MYATDGHSLVRLSLRTRTFSRPVSFHGCDLAVVEITLDDAGVMFGAGYERGRAALYRIDAETGECVVVKQFQTEGQWSVGFLHKTLVAVESSGYVLIDAMNGNRTTITPAPTAMMREGGDIVLGTDGSAWMSELTRSPDTSFLERIDPDTGRILQQFALPEGIILEGLATADDMLYGFTTDGRVLRVSVDMGIVTLAPIATFDGPAHFTGAASIAVTPPR